MSEPLFDPSRMAQARAIRGENVPWTVSQLAARIDDALRGTLPERIRVVGEVSNFRDRTHWYFDLKDADAIVSCAMWGSVLRRVPFTPANGQAVVVTGRIEFYAKQGRATLIGEQIEPVGAGALELAYRALCNELRALGWFDEARKRPLPAFPRRIAVVTSRTAAALQDVLDTMRRRCAAVDVALIDVRVQGDGAAEEVAGAIRWVGQLHDNLGIEAVLVTRGGGSLEDLWAFNARIVAEAIVACPVPVVAAIGHETDTTIAELVADVRAATPTQAAMRVTPDSRALLEQLASHSGRLQVSSSRLLRFERQRLAGAARHPFFADPASLVSRKRETLAGTTRHLGSALESRFAGATMRLERASARLEAGRPAAVYARRNADCRHAAEHLAQAWSTGVRRAAMRLDAIEKRLAAVGPIAVLRRGYSVTIREDGRLVRSRADAVPGERLKTRVADGVIDSVVEGRRPARKPKVPSQDLPGLFDA